MIEPKVPHNIETPQGNILNFPIETKQVVPVSESKTKGTSSKTKLRIYAFFTDLFFIGLLQKILVFSYVNFVNEVFHQVPGSVKRNLLGSLSEMRIQTLVFTFFSYFLVSLYLGHGQTLGKTLFKLRVLSFEDEPSDLSFMEAFMRTLGYTTCYVTAMVNPLLPFILFSIPVFKKNGTGIPDIFSQTEVVTENEYKILLQKLEEEAQSQKETEDEDHQLELFAS